jgi:hypothetical protein
MPLSASDIKFYKSTNADSDGGAIDTAREILSGVDNNLLPDLTGQEQMDGGTRYRKFFVKNTHATLSWLGVRQWIGAQPSNSTFSVGWGLDHADDADPLQGNMTAFTAAAKVALVSDGTDTRTVTVVGEDAAGNYQTESVALTSTTEKLTTATFGRVYAVYVATLSGVRTVTVKQGSGGPVRGTIGPNKKLCFLWRTGADIDTEAEGTRYGDLAAGAAAGVWLRQVWPAGTASGTGFSGTLSFSGQSS